MSPLAPLSWKKPRYQSDHDNKLFEGIDGLRWLESREVAYSDFRSGEALDPVICETQDNA